MMESLREDGIFTERLMLCEGLVQARDEHISQTNINPECYYIIGASELMDNTWDNIETLYAPKKPN